MSLHLVNKKTIEKLEYLKNKLDKYTSASILDNNLDTDTYKNTLEKYEKLYDTVKDIVIMVFNKDKYKCFYKYDILTLLNKQEQLELTELENNNTKNEKK